MVYRCKNKQKIPRGPQQDHVPFDCDLHQSTHLYEAMLHDYLHIFASSGPSEQRSLALGLGVGLRSTTVMRQSLASTLSHVYIPGRL